MKNKLTEFEKLGNEIAKAFGIENEGLDFEYKSDVKYSIDTETVSWTQDDEEYSEDVYYPLTEVDGVEGVKIRDYQGTSRFLFFNIENKEH